MTVRPEQQLSLLEESEEPAFVDRRPKFRAFSNRVWSKAKSQLIEKYLYYFVLITRHGTYIDGFSGPQYSNELDKWSAKRVLESRPRWLRHFFFCELNAASVKKLEHMVAGQAPRVPKKEPKRDVRVIAGDFNIQYESILNSGVIRDKEATFCLLDQRTFECHWATVEAIARHKPAGRRIELLYFLPIKWLKRALAAQSDKAVIERWWGRSDWHILQDCSNDGIREQFVKRFDELGYAHVSAWPIYSWISGQQVMYYMIQATDHPDAPKIMFRAYKRVVTPNVIEQLPLGLESVEFED
ncbi:MAG: three-Cys-motif partner protein TcmP [Burkholderiales bacterium]|nr:three-Cys-motif partner protein TcmP [Burkholderiales bacterium]